jgi:hypothetical protein
MGPRPGERPVEPEEPVEFFGKNVGPADRTIRIIGGLVILSFAVFGPQTPWGLLGLIPLATGLFGTCPVYSLFGFSTNPEGKGPGSPAVR